MHNNIINDFSALSKSWYTPRHSMKITMRHKFHCIQIRRLQTSPKAKWINTFGKSCYFRLVSGRSGQGIGPSDPVRENNMWCHETVNGNALFVLIWFSNKANTVWYMRLWNHDAVGNCGSSVCVLSMCPIYNLIEMKIWKVGCSGWYPMIRNLTFCFTGGQFGHLGIVIACVCVCASITSLSAR